MTSEQSLTLAKEEEVREINNEFDTTDSDDPISYDEEGRAGRFLIKRSWSDVFTIICSGCALLSDGYQNSCMNMLNSVFSVAYPKDYTSSVKTRVSNALTIGEIIGQITVGLTCDYYGRRWAILMTTSVIVIGSILGAAMNGATIAGMFWMLTVARGVTGFGVGGEYPASCTSAAEASNEAVKRRGGVLVLVTNFPLSLGTPFALIVFLIVYTATGSGTHLTTCARILLGLGCVWPIAVFYFRWKMATPLLYKKSAIRRNVPYLLSIKFYWRRLIGTGACWFLYDFITFPNSVFSSTIISSVMDDTTNLTKVAEWNLLLAVFSIPGVLIGAYLVDRIGRKYTMCIGFSGYVIMGLIIGCAYNKIKKIVPLFIVFYALFTALGNGGPGDVLGLASSESYASPIRGTFYGFCAAVGKAGAAIGTEAFTPIENNLGKNWTFIISAICGAVGVTLCYFFVPHLKDPDLMAEDIRYLRYVRAHGWTGTFGIQEEAKQIKAATSDATEE